MNKRTLEALKGSIKKWAGLARGRGSDRGSANCDLCKLFAGAPLCCEGCPVKAKTGQKECWGTPYYRWVKYADDKAGDWAWFYKDMRVPKSGRRRERALKAAKAMRDFLKSLLPEGESA